MDHRLEYLMVFLRQTLPFLVIIYLPIYLKSIGLAGYQIGILMSLVAVSSFLFTFPIGVFNDRLTSRSLIILSMWLVAIYYLGLSAFTSFWLLIIVFIISGVSSSLFEISIKSLFYKTVSKFGKGKSLGTFTFFDGMGIAAGYILGGFLLGAFDFRTVFILSAFACLILSLTAFRLPKVKTFHIVLHDYFKDMQKSQVLLFGLLIFIISLHWGPERVNMGLFVKENIGLGMSQMGLFLGTSVMFLALGVYYYGRRYDSGYPLKKILLIGLLFNGIGSIGWYFTTDAYLAFFIRSIQEFGDGAMAAFMAIHTTNLFTKKRMGGDSSIIVLITVIGSTAGAILAGVLADLYSNLLPIILSGVISILAIGLIPLLRLYPLPRIKKNLNNS